ncbi:predicted protein [Thalassiosira pseudonana CCMP1335]|uniref:Uncharacterized protein n=1 Tax=Thalassiosira pseudonana TaxID=35128 RepID=B8C2W4_THAPS|nr:predicted protein [Thalassiosira pseudonana CCMP1335]EED92019.1 predicted protein [Thalassiosira pseudonana CCMP1335]
MASSSAKKEETMFKSESSLDALGDVTGTGLEDEIDLILKEPVIDAHPDLPAFDNYDGYDCESFRFSNQMKVDETVLAKKRSVSDDDLSDLSFKLDERKPITQANGITMQDLLCIIDEAEEEKSITTLKADRLRKYLRSESLMDMIHHLLCENIPLKRNGLERGYKCRVCQVPLKGHICLYCPVCSTLENKVKKGCDHLCFNCTTCYDKGKMKKKVVQVRIDCCDCTGHSKPSSKDAEAKKVSTKAGKIFKKTKKRLVPASAQDSPPGSDWKVLTLVSSYIKG